MGQGQDTALGGGSGGKGGLNDLLAQYNSGFGDLTNAYLQKQGKGLIDMPSFQEMFNSYKNVAQENTQRASANLTESFGSQGARYGSDILRGQATLQRQLGNDLTQKAGDVQLGLRQQQSNELMPFLQQETGNRQNAMSYLFNDFLRRTSPPPGLAAAGSYASGYGPPNVIAY